MEERPRIEPTSCPPEPTAQKDIRDYFKPSNKRKLPTLPIPSRSTADVKVRSDAARNAIFEEWKPPACKPHMPRSKDNGYPPRTSPRPRGDPAYTQTENIIQISAMSRKYREGDQTGHIRAQTENLTSITTGSHRRTRSGSEDRSGAPIFSLGTTKDVDHSLMPRPLKLSSHHSHPLFADGRSITPVIESPRLLTRSSFMSNFEQRGYGIEPSFADLMSKEGNRTTQARHFTREPISQGPELQESGSGEDDEDDIYFLPSPSLIMPVLNVADKVRKLLGTAGDESYILNPVPCKLAPSME
jgi:hypothetical protein